jgi:hypothetical protein
LRSLSLMTLLLLASCAGSGSPPQTPPIWPQQAAPRLAAPRLETFDLGQPPLTQVKLLDPRVVAAVQTDHFTQSAALIDVLWVVSNAGTMKNELDDLGQSLPAFVQVLADSKANWQMGVTSSDRSGALLPDGGLIGANGGTLQPPGVISVQDPNYVIDFKNALVFPIDRNTASAQSSIFASMRIALTQGSSTGLVRPGASLAVIAASNSDDQTLPGTPGFYARWLKEQKPKGDEALVTFSALGGPPGKCSPKDQATLFGAQVSETVRLEQLVADTGGVFESICADDFSSALKKIALNLKTLRRYFPLSVVPDPSSILVTVDGQPVAQDAAGGWQYLAPINSVAFLGSFVPDPGARITITYPVGG